MESFREWLVKEEAARDAAIDKARNALVKPSPRNLELSRYGATCKKLKK